MEAEGDLFRLIHIMDSIVKIEELVEILATYENFERRWIERDALIRNFEIIGEASHHISKTTQIKYPDIAWREIKDMRNYMSHVYFGLQLDSVWDAAINDIPVLKKQIQKIISDIEAV